MSSTYHVFSATSSWSPKILIEAQLFSDQTIITVVIDTFSDAQTGENAVVVTVWIILKFSHISYQLK